MKNELQTLNLFPTKFGKDHTLEVSPRSEYQIKHNTNKGRRKRKTKNKDTVLAQSIPACAALHTRPARENAHQAAKFRVNHNDPSGRFSGLLCSDTGGIADSKEAFEQPQGQREIKNHPERQLGNTARERTSPFPSHKQGISKAAPEDPVQPPEGLEAHGRQKKYLSGTVITATQPGSDKPCTTHRKDEEGVKSAPRNTLGRALVVVPLGTEHQR